MIRLATPPGCAWRLFAAAYIYASCLPCTCPGSQVRKTQHLVPQECRASCRAKSSLDLADDMVTMGYLNEGRRGFMGGLSKLFGNSDNAESNPGEAASRADVFICVNASTVELKDIECYAQEYAGGKTLILWNMELDTLRADLGGWALAAVWQTLCPGLAWQLERQCLQACWAFLPRPCSTASYLVSHLSSTSGSETTPR